LRDGEFVNVVWNDDLKAGQFAFSDDGAYLLIRRGLWRPIMDILGAVLNLEALTREYRELRSPDAREGTMPAEAAR
jgi:hypothetical protein